MSRPLLILFTMTVLVGTGCSPQAQAESDTQTAAASSLLGRWRLLADELPDDLPLYMEFFEGGMVVASGGNEREAGFYLVLVT